MLRLVFWGTYDSGKPRVRLLLQGARSAGMEVIECHADLWKGIEDKSQIFGLKNKLKKLLSCLLSYPSLIWRYMRLPPHDAVLVCYMGQLDILVLKPFARLRSVPVIWDAFLSLYDATVNDRQLISKHSARAWLLYLLEWLSCRAADGLFLDTAAHARYFEHLFSLSEGQVGRVFVGAETERFPDSRVPTRQDGNNRTFKVLFYGQFIPLHGIEFIVRAAQKVELSGEQVQWILIGRGQESRRIDGLINELGVTAIERVPWVAYEELIKWMVDADVCLGIFGTTKKASLVIPNKVYQILAAQRPLITADTSAIRELLSETERIWLIPPGCPEKLAEVIIEMKHQSSESGQHIDGNMQKSRVIGPVQVGEQLLDFFIAKGVVPVRSS